jgi:hypothetical protein
MFPASDAVPKRILERFQLVISKFGDVSPSSSSFRVLQNCTPGTDAQGLLDENTGDLWVSVWYPDWSGDSPGCFSLTQEL